MCELETKIEIAYNALMIQLFEFQNAYNDWWVEVNCLAAVYNKTIDEIIEILESDNADDYRIPMVKLDI